MAIFVFALIPSGAQTYDSQCFAATSFTEKLDFPAPCAMAATGAENMSAVQQNTVGIMEQPTTSMQNSRHTQAIQKQHDQDGMMP
jgi:hypothetical protein